MDPQRNIQAVERLMVDPAFSKSVKSAKSLREIVFLFAEKGVNVREEDLKNFLTDYGEEDELSESALESVIGGYVTVSAAVLLCLGHIMNQEEPIVTNLSKRRK